MQGLYVYFDMYQSFNDKAFHREACGRDRQNTKAYTLMRL